MPKRKSLEELKREEEKLKEALAKKRQRLQALKKKVQSEYRKREARFLITIGRTLLKYGQIGYVEGEKVIMIPLKNSIFKTSFKEYDDIVNLNDDFKKWLSEFD